mgnify:FL=1
MKETFNGNGTGTQGTPAAAADQQHYTTGQQAKMPLTDYYLNKFDGGAQTLGNLRPNEGSDPFLQPIPEGENSVMAAMQKQMRDRGTPQARDFTGSM